MTKVEKIKVWTKDWNGKGGFKKEFRVYIDLSDGRRGGLFLTGNPYQEKGSLDGRITQEDVGAARGLAHEMHTDGRWHTMYQEDCELAYRLREIRAQA